MRFHARGPARLAWLDRFIVPRETPIAPSRWHQHIVQRRVSRLDHLRPHRLNWEALKHPEPAEAAAGVEDETLTPRRLAGIRWSWLDGLFTTVSDNLYLGFIVLYALAYGASTSQLGLLAAIQNLLGAVSLFPGARAADAARHRKPLVTWTVGGFARIALLALALVPWMTQVPATAIWLIIALNGIRSFMSNFGNPAWTVLIGDLVPPRPARAVFRESQSHDHAGGAPGGAPRRLAHQGRERMARPAEPRLPGRVRPRVPHGPGRHRLLPAHPGAAPDGPGAPGRGHDRPGSGARSPAIGRSSD